MPPLGRNMASKIQIAGLSLDELAVACLEGMRSADQV